MPSTGDAGATFACDNWRLTEVGQINVSQARALGIGDLNGDGIPDLAVYGIGIQVLLGDGKGRFTPFGPAVDANGGIQGFALADVNLDSKLDLVVDGVAGGYSVEVFAGNGDGTFQTGVTVSALSDFGGEPAVGDVNGDGKPDILVALGGDNLKGPNPRGAVAVFLNNGDGTFQPEVDYATGTGPVDIAIADVNGDGRADLAVADANSRAPAGSVSVLLGNGDGTFQAAVDYATDSEPRSVAIGDLNGDGKPDLALSNAGTNDVSVLLGRGDGTFEPQATYATDSNPQSIVLRDLNGDGFLDAIVGDSGSNDLSVLLGRGDGTFQTQRTFPNGGDDVAVDDLNGDGKPDVAVVDGPPESVSILLDTCGL